MSLTEILVILAVVLLVVGPERIPALARKLGGALRELRRASNFFRDAFMLEDDLRPDSGGSGVDVVHDASSTPRNSPPTGPESTTDPSDSPDSSPDVRVEWIDLPSTARSTDLEPIGLPASEHSDLIRSRPLPYPLITY
ncbi:MAG: twin-arginine translocase TatA/TatE family subunit [Bradymonadaceae bacterium]